MAIEELASLVPPPARPVAVGGQQQWAQVQQQLGTRLPGELRDFGQVYGSGYFDDPGRLRIYVWNPFDRSYRWHVASAYRQLMMHYDIGDERQVPIGQLPPDPIYLPWGSDIDGNLLCWLRQGEPDAWPIVLLAPTRNGFQQLQRSLGNLLAAAFTRRLALLIWNAGAYFSGRISVRFIPEQDRNTDVAQERRGGPDH